MHSMTRAVDVGKTRSAKRTDFRFIDLFAGIGGVRQAFEQQDGRCVFTSEWDKFAQVTYRAKFPSDDHELVGDIRQVPREDIPEHEVLLAGFTCQPFSLASVSKKNSLGQAHGSADPTQGTFFHEIKSTLEYWEPDAFMLENVKHLLNDDGGRTFDVVHSALVDLGYDVHYKVIDAAHFFPQHRERIIIVGFKRQTDFTWDDLCLPAATKQMEDVLHRTDGREPMVENDGNRFSDHDSNLVQPKYTLSERFWTYLQGYVEKLRKSGNGFGYGLMGHQSVSRTLSARYRKDGSEILVQQEGSVPRRLTPRECARLIAFPDSFVIPVSDVQPCRQFGNSVVFPAAADVARIMVPQRSCSTLALRIGA